MALQYAKFDTMEFNCLRSDLKGVESIIGMLESELAVDKLLDQLQSLLRGRPSFAQAITRIEEEIATMSEARAARNGTRESMASQVVDRVRTLMQEEWTIGRFKAGEVLQNCAEIFNSYSVFDSDEFSKLKDSLFSSEDGDTVEDQIKQLNSEVKKIRAHIKKTWSPRRMVKFFRFVPPHWRARVISEDFIGGDMCIFILRSLVASWKERSPCYNVPVTVTGVAIRSLDRDREEIWMRLYEKLGLKPVTSAIFLHEDAGLRGKTIGERTEESLPGLFDSEDIVPEIQEDSATSIQESVEE